MTELENRDVATAAHGFIKRYRGELSAGQLALVKKHEALMKALLTLGPQTTVGAINNVIRMAAAKFGISANWKSLRYDPGLEDTGSTDQHGNIRLGPRAFASGFWLASTIYHETIHVQQLPEWSINDQGQAVLEAQAYSSELDAAGKFGLYFLNAGADVLGVEGRLNNELGKLDDSYLDRISNGDYSLQPGDRLTPLMQDIFGL